MNELLNLLREQAADLGDFTTPAHAVSWKVNTNSLSLQVEALTRKLSADQEEAWRTATELRNAIPALGYKPHGTCHVGVASETGPEPASTDPWVMQMPICGWRGFVSLNMRPMSL